MSPSSDHGSTKQPSLGGSTLSFNIPPKPILNKSDQELLPKLQTSVNSSSRSTDSPNPLVTPINQMISPQLHSASAGFKHTNSISFNVPSGVEKSHRGSISARPSQVNIGSTYPAKISSPQPPVQARQSPGIVHPAAAARSSSLSGTSTDLISSVGHPSSQPSLQQPLQQQQLQQLQQLQVQQRKASPSPFSSRQGSHNGDFIHFFSKNNNNAHQEPTSDSRSNSVSSNVSFQLPSASTNSEIPDFNGGIPPISSESISIHPKKSKTTPKAIVASPTGPVVPFTQYLQREDDNKIHILIGATGSVATIKVPLIIDKLQKIYGPEKVSIQLVVTKPAEHFLRGSKISTEVKIWRDSDEWSNTFGRPGDPILHVELRKWADVFLIAPLSANTLAKIANGLCDNLLTSIIRSWNPTLPIFVAPAMNTLMYTHPMTKKHLGILAEDFKFITVLKPVEKVLVCGDIGMGGMREWTDIVDTIMRKIKEIKLAKLALLRLNNDLTADNQVAEGVSDVDEGDEDEDEDDDDDDDDYRSDDEDTDSSDDSNSDEDDEDDLDMELDAVVADNEEAKRSVDNLTHHFTSVLSMTGDPIKDHHFRSTLNLI